MLLQHFPEIFFFSQENTSGKKPLQSAGPGLQQASSPPAQAQLRWQSCFTGAQMSHLSAISSQPAGLDSAGKILQHSTQTGAKMCVSIL